MKTALLFAGQGSQYVGMMKDIANEFPLSNEILDKANDILGYDIKTICFNGPKEALTETRYTQPALFLHGAVVMDILDGKLDFDATAGHSVGEYAALYASKVLKFEDALKLVALRGKLMFEAGQHEPGTMFAVIGMKDEKVEEICSNLTENGDGIIVPANYNSPGQIVISGSRDYLREKIKAFKEAGARMTMELNVSGAFHSPLVQPAKEELEKAINSTGFKDAVKPVYSNVFAKPLTKAEDIKNALILQLTSPVKWTQTLINMQQDEISRFVEIGPGKVLQGLVKRTLKDVEIDGIDKAGELQKKL
jgi:[acyl-carrier-protein] S-malonyltransferase